MWSYYGSKAKMIHLYPPPKYGRVIEPFAGTARYALKFFDRDVLLVDKNEVIIKIWQWLQKCSKDDILKLPRLKEAEKLSDYKFDCDEARWLMGFLVNVGVSQPMNQATYRATTHRPNFMNFQIKKIASNLFKIKHWKIQAGSYDEIENTEATWFIDPPYQFGGEYYPHGSQQINYKTLSEWCQSRNGQIIVCENTKAEWLNFQPMKKFSGSRHKTVEAIWSNIPTAFDFQQMSFLQERPLTPHALDGGDSAPSLAVSSPEVLSTLLALSTPPHRQ